MTTIQFRRGTAEEWAQADPVLAEGEPGVELVTGLEKIGDGVTVWSELPYFLHEDATGERFLPREISAPDAPVVHAFRIMPQDEGYAPFQLSYVSVDNRGGGTGSRNHATQWGYNPGFHIGGGTTPGQPGWYVGLEDNYFDPDDDQAHGVEWYVSYATPDGTTVSPGQLRPFYCRVINSQTNDADKSAIVQVDTGGGSHGSFTVYAGITTGEVHFHINNREVVAHRKFKTIKDAEFNGRANFVADVSAGTHPTDRLVLGQIDALPTSANGAFVGWAHGLDGATNGDLVLVPRTSIQGSVRFYVGSGPQGPQPAARISADGLDVTHGVRAASVISTGSVTATSVIGSSGPNGNLLLRMGTPEGKVVVTGPSGSTVHFSVDSGGLITLGDGVVINAWGASGARLGGHRNQKWGFWGAAPTAKPSGTPGKATDLDTALELVNDLREKLIRIGLME